MPLKGGLNQFGIQTDVGFLKLPITDGKSISPRMAVQQMPASRTCARLMPLLNSSLWKRI